MSEIIQRTEQEQLLIDKRLPELVTIEKLLRHLQGRARVTVETTVEHNGTQFPIHSIVVGTEDKRAPCLAIFGGVHGLERIGSEVTIAYLQTVAELMRWDESFNERLTKSRILFMPLVNPVGTFLRKRANGRGVDLMRNSPVEADVKPAFLLGGHRFSAKLPWYRGEGKSMEQESQALCGFVERELFPSRLALSLDVHSGFGAIDRLWFPYARTTKPPPNLLELVSLKRLFDRSYPNHFYRIEPQASQYTTHGDLWDYLYDQQRASQKESVYLPWTLELGSWLWLKKNPRQAFSALGAFNPTQPHRLRRTLRRHITLFDFLHRALLSPSSWLDVEENDRHQMLKRAMEQWYAE